MKKLLLPLLCLSAANAFGQSFSDLGKNHLVEAISGNGNVVVGTTYAPNNYYDLGIVSYRWQGGTSTIFNSDGVDNRPAGVSADGSKIVGVLHGVSYTAKYTYSNGVNTLGSFNDYYGGSLAGISANGQRVAGSDSYYTSIPCQVGCSWYGDTQVFDGTYAFVEDSNAKIKLGDLAGGANYSWARGISADGNTVVGESTSASGLEAFRWTQGGSMVGLGDLSGGAFDSAANAVNGDGTMIVGVGTSGSGKEAFLWTAANGMTGLGDLGGGAFNSSALSISSDGSTIVGYGTAVDGQKAVAWDSVHGARDLQLLATGLGMDLTGWNLFGAKDVSDDGLVIAGEGKYLGQTHGWVLDFRGMGYTSFSQIPSPVPVPAAVWMFGTSLAGLALMRRRQA